MFGDKPKSTIYAKFAYPDNGYESDKKHGEELTVGNYYEVSHISMGQSNTSIHLKDVLGVFNSVQFEFFDKDKGPIDIYTMPEFNHYIRGDML